MLNGMATGDHPVRGETRCVEWKNWLAGLLWVAVALLLPAAALEPVSLASAASAPALALGACADGSAHLAMGCASISL